MNQGPNISKMIMHDPKLFNYQAELYQAEHKKFLYNAAKCKVGSRADRVYTYYGYNNDWRRDKYLSISQEANNKPLESREGRKLDLHAYYKKMALHL